MEKKRKEIHLTPEVFKKLSYQAMDEGKALKPYLEEVLEVHSLTANPINTLENIRNILRNIREFIPYERQSNRPNWSIVQHVFLAHQDETSKKQAITMCENIGIDPDAYEI